MQIKSTNRTNKEKTSYKYQFKFEESNFIMNNLKPIQTNFNRLISLTSQIRMSSSIKPETKQHIQDTKEAMKQSLSDIKQSGQEKFQEMKGQAEEKAQEVKESAQCTMQAAKEKAQDIQAATVEKAQEVKEATLEKAQEAVDTSKGVFTTMGEKMGDAKHYIADTAKAAVEKVEHLGQSIKETVIGPAHESVQEAGEKAKHGAQQVAEQVEHAASEAKDQIRRS